jgi:thiol:disulfide interchange protein DsbC
MIGPFLFSCLLFLGSSFALTKEEAAIILKEMILGEFKVLEVKEAPLEGFWEVVAEVGQGHEKTIVYIDNKNLRFVFHGQILDRQTKKNITLEKLKELRTVDVSKLPLENAISIGEGKRRIYVFTNPECYFCSQLHEEFKQLKNVKGYFFVIASTPSSYEKAKSIWCSPDRGNALDEVYHGKEPKPASCNTGAIDRNIELARRLLIDSTPTLILQNGKVIEGYASPHALEDLLKSD